MVRLQHYWIVVALVLAINGGLFAQSSTSAQADPAPAAAVSLPSAPGANLGGGYLSRRQTAISQLPLRHLRSAGAHQHFSRSWTGSE
jgi:hypothetical protein